MSRMTISDLTAASFDAFVSEGGPVLVSFWGPGCARCRALAPVLDELAATYRGRVAFGRVNAAAEAALTAEFRVMRLPTVLLFSDGARTPLLAGEGDAHDLEARLEAAL